MTKVREVMSEGVELLDGGSTVAEAAQRMAASDVGALPVCGADGRLQGMITDRDVAVKVVAGGMDPTTTKLTEIIDVDEVVTIGADDTLEEAVRTMKDHAVRRLPVIDGTEVIGLLSQGDLAKSLPEAQVGELIAAISSAP